jgi:hypothetical protein
MKHSGRTISDTTLDLIQEAVDEEFNRIFAKAKAAETYCNFFRTTGKYVIIATSP